MPEVKTNAQIANGIVNAWGLNDVNDPHAGDALRGRIEAALDAKDRSVADTKEDEAHAESLLPCPRCETLIYTHRCDGNNGRGCGGSRHPCSICGKNQNGLRERRATAPKVEKK